VTRLSPFTLKEELLQVTRLNPTILGPMYLHAVPALHSLPELVSRLTLTGLTAHSLLEGPFHDGVFQ